MMPCCVVSIASGGCKDWRSPLFQGCWAHVAPTKCLFLWTDLDPHISLDRHEFAPKQNLEQFSRFAQLMRVHLSFSTITATKR